MSKAKWFVVWKPSTGEPYQPVRLCHPNSVEVQKKCCTIFTRVHNNKSVQLPYGFYTRHLDRMRLVSCPAPPCTCKKGGSGVLNDFSCHSSPIKELESDCRTSSSTRSSMPAVQFTCMGNAIITFFMPFDPAPCDKKCHSEHQTLFPLFGGGVWGRD